MRFSVNYLSQFVDRLPKNVAVLSKQLINLGIEVENVTNYPNEDIVIEVAVAPNRADLLSIVGIARELAAINNAKLIVPSSDTNRNNTNNNTNTIYTIIKEAKHNKQNIYVYAPDVCPKYFALAIKDINTKAKTPSWVAQVLDYAGINLISPVVDLANYVMLELGQPLHTFDLDLIAGGIKGIQVRLARPNEELNLLNNSTIKLNCEDLIIADDQNPLALAGIMGGLYSAINENTNNILIECAYFEPIGIRKSAARHNLLSDAAQRFSRGTDPNLPELAIARFVDLLIEVVGGTISDFKLNINPEYLPKTTYIDLYQEKINRILGVDIEKNQIISILQNLGIKTHQIDDRSLLEYHWKTTIPSWRQDLKIQEDLIEELARFYGYNNINKQQIYVPLEVKMPTSELNFTQELQYKNCLANRGYKEAINYSFIDPDIATMFYPQEEHYTLKNPISKNMSVMRPGLLPGLFSALIYNQNRQKVRVRLFELGKVFSVNIKNNIVIENKKISAIASGTLLEENWQANTDINFFNLKSDILAILKQGQDITEDNVFFEPISHPVFHPYQAANIYINDKLIGLVGTLHPKLGEKYSIQGLPLMFELNLNLIHGLNLRNFISFSKFPSIRRDFSIILDYKVNFAQIKKLVYMACGELLKKIILFDVYNGKKLPEGKKSIAFGVILQSDERTLVEEEINNIVSKIIYNLNEMGANLRN